jgi:hypothetical protein
VSIRAAAVRLEGEHGTEAGPNQEDHDMTQYLLSVWFDDHEAEAASPTGGYADEAEMQAAFEATDRFNQKLQEAGAWVFAGGLEAPSTATVVDGMGADVVMTDGPYAETKEQIGGFWIIEAPDLDAAVQWAAEGSAACKGKVEVRPFQAEPEA